MESGGYNAHATFDVSNIIQLWVKFGFEVDIFKNKDFLEEGVPSCASARLGNRSCAITPCCPPVIEAGKFITFANVLSAAQTNWW